MSDVAVEDPGGGSRRAIDRRLTLWLVGSAAGVLLLALPDDDERVFSISETHGPSSVDLVGMAVVIGAWVPAAALMWSGWGVLVATERRLVGGALAVGVVVLAVTVGLDLGAWWLAAVALLLTPQVFLLHALWSRT